MKIFALSIIIAFSVMGVARADVASTDYVQDQVNNRVALSGDEVQTMTGKYSISGTMEVPTPSLPATE